MEDDRFKNPFQLDEDNMQMISLDPVKIPLPSVSSQPPTFVPAPQPKKTQQSPSTTSKLNISQASMFDLIDTKEEEDLTKPVQEVQDPPLLQDIGIDPQLIKKRLVAVLTLEQANQQLVTTPDLAGPIVISLLLGFLLMLGGKMHFSDIESAFIIGAILLYVLFNFMNRTPDTIPLYSIMSFLGYSLLPMLALAILGIFSTLTGPVPILLSLALAGWSSYSCSNLFLVLLNRSDSKWLIMYPLFLFYTSFAMIIIY